MILSSPVVAKIGGSLLALSGDLAQRIHAVLRLLRGSKVLIIVVGGGVAAMTFNSKLLS